MTAAEKAEQAAVTFPADQQSGFVRDKYREHCRNRPAMSRQGFVSVRKPKNYLLS